MTSIIVIVCCAVLRCGAVFAGMCSEYFQAYFVLLKISVAVWYDRWRLFSTPTFSLSLSICLSFDRCIYYITLCIFALFQIELNFVEEAKYQKPANEKREFR